MEVFLLIILIEAFIALAILLISIFILEKESNIFVKFIIWLLFSSFITFPTIGVNEKNIVWDILVFIYYTAIIMFASFEIYLNYKEFIDTKKEEKIKKEILKRRNNENYVDYETFEKEYESILFSKMLKHPFPFLYKEYKIKNLRKAFEDYKQYKENLNQDNKTNEEEEYIARKFIEEYYDREKKEYEDRKRIEYDDKIIIKSKHIVQENKEKKPKSNHQFLIEQNTYYSNKISRIKNIDFKSIRNISTDEINMKTEKERLYLWQKLYNGVEILTDTTLLDMYMYSYGKMHKAKLEEAFKAVIEFNEDSIQIYDWACGMGMATITFLDYITKGFHPSIKEINLIDPSQIALKRASLLTKKIIDTKIITINKKLEYLAENDLNNTAFVKFHFFSNILDIEDFSIENLANLIENNFSHENYFFCVSPYINEYKTNRINDFASYFENKYQYEELKSLTMQKGEWKDDWSIVLRVFKVVL